VYHRFLATGIADGEHLASPLGSGPKASGPSPPRNTDSVGLLQPGHLSIEEVSERGRFGGLALQPGPELLNVSRAANWDDLQTGNRPMAWS